MGLGIVKHTLSVGKKQEKKSNKLKLKVPLAVTRHIYVDHYFSTCSLYGFVL